MHAPRPALDHPRPERYNEYGTVALDRFVPLYPLDAADLASRAAAVARETSFLLAWPTPGSDLAGRRRLRGPILASLELGGDLADVPDVWHREDGRLEPFAFIRSFSRDSAYAWLARLWLGGAALFTTTGLDVQRIVDAPTRDAHGRFRFDLVSGPSSLELDVT